MMTRFDGCPLIPLNRPQYVSAPEAFISALAWREFTIELGGNPKKTQARRYSHVSAGSSKAMEVLATKPEPADQSAFAAALTKNGFNSTNPSVTARAILESVAGVRVEKSGVQPASPMSPAIALSQNLPGLQGSANPPDIAGILESMFAMGVGVEDRHESVSGLWKRAANRRLEIDPVLRGIDASFNTAVLGPRVERSPVKPSFDADSLPYFGQETPFAWFNRSWSRLCSDEWVQALPPRVWVDWATTVTRMAFGMGFLWESAWYDAFAREALDTNPVPNVAARLAPQPLMAWRPSNNGLSVRDVASALKWRVHRGVRIRAVLEAELKDGHLHGEEINAQILQIRSRDESLKALTNAVQSSVPTGSGKNAWEAVRYALRTRDSAADAADYYGLLATRSRFLIPAPGTEWVAVIASLACEYPAGRTEVATIMRDLRALGLRPELGTMIELLEQAGLARGSADADQGVVVESAF